jgi:hypothetical protein
MSAVIFYEHGATKTDMMRDKHFRLDQRKIDCAKRIFGVKAETEAVNAALDTVIRQSSLRKERQQVVKRILKRREKLKRISGDIAEWVR